MKTQHSEKIYLIGSCYKGVESLIVRDAAADSVLHFDSLEKAKLSFKSAYDILLTPDFEPSIPPTPAEINYHDEMMRLVVIAPFILEMERATCSEELMSWRNKQQPLFSSDVPLFNIAHWYCPMKKGFIRRYSALDIVKDIEEVLFIAADGKIVVRSHRAVNASNVQPLTADQIQQLLRDRGLR